MALCRIFNIMPILIQLNLPSRHLLVRKLVFGKLYVCTLSNAALALRPQISNKTALTPQRTAARAKMPAKQPLVIEKGSKNGDSSALGISKRILQ
jgi:hypothetical protein